MLMVGMVGGLHRLFMAHCKRFISISFLKGAFHDKNISRHYADKDPETYLVLLASNKTF
jgi:hypothetical protein